MPLTTSAPARATAIDLYAMQFRLRTFEKRAHEIFIEGLIKGTSHLATGQEAIAAGFAAVAPGGALCLYAPPDPGVALGLDGHALYVGEVDVCASYSAGPADMRAALALVASGRVDPLPLVTHRLGLDETGRALELQRRGEAIKVLVSP